MVPFWPQSATQPRRARNPRVAAALGMILLAALGVARPASAQILDNADGPTSPTAASPYRPQLRRADTLTTFELRQSPPLAPPIAPPWRSDAPASPTLTPTPTTPTLTTATADPIDYSVLSFKLRLDRAFFSPTLVDDQRWDRRYRQATRAYQMAHGLQIDGIAGPETSASLGRFTAPLTTAVLVRPADLDALRPVPRAKDYLAMAEFDRLGHRDLREALAERFHTSEDFLDRLNPHLDWNALAPGDAVTVPNVRRRRAPFFAARVEVNVADRHVRVFDAEGRLRAHFNCSIGTDADVYERLQLEVINTVEWPNYTLDPRLFGLAHRVSGRLLLPPGPNNPVGRAWVGLNRSGYGIHGTPDPEDIGHTRSLGCIRLANWDALTFAHMVRAGTPVTFLGHWRPTPEADPDPDASEDATPEEPETEKDEVEDDDDDEGPAQEDIIEGEGRRDAGGGRALWRIMRNDDDETEDETGDEDDAD